MIEVQYWINTSDGYDNRYMTVETGDEEEALETVKKAHPRGKDFKIVHKYPPYNEKLLKEDVKFPLNWDTDEYKMYIFDSDNNMIAQVDYENIDPTNEYHPFEKLIGDYKEVLSSLNPKYYLHEGDFYDVFKNAGDPIGCVRGWGRLQKLKSPSGEKRQDNIAAYILNVINS